MRLQVTAWPRIGGEKYRPGDEVDVAPGLAKMLIRDGQARPAGTPEPVAGSADTAQAAVQPDAAPAAGEDATGTPPPVKPGRGAGKDELVAYAVRQGLDEETARAMSRAQLTAHVSDA